MVASFRQTLLLMLLVVAAIGIPLWVARALLSESRIDSVAADRVNYLSHRATPNSLEATEDILKALLERPVDASAPVPRIFLASLPSALPDIGIVSERKAMFVSTLLPLILRANELILADRAVLIRLRDKLRTGGKLRNSEKAWLRTREAQYRVRPDGARTPSHLDRLLRRVDVVPPSLALTQAAIESGWGTSRFAQDGNALFGEWLYGNSGRGLVPKNRDAGKNHRIKTFDYLLDSVRSYMTNLNRNRAYRALREARASLRRRGEKITGMALIPSLKSYSERGTDYIDDLYTVMQFNDFARFDVAHLEGGRPVT